MSAVRSSRTWVSRVDLSYTFAVDQDPLSAVLRSPLLRREDVKKRK